MSHPNKRNCSPQQQQPSCSTAFNINPTCTCACMNNVEKGKTHVCSEHNDKEKILELYLKDLEEKLIKEERMKLKSCERLVGNNKKNLVRSHGFIYKPVKDVGVEPCPEILANETENRKILCSRNKLINECLTKFRQRTNNNVHTDLQGKKCTDIHLKQIDSYTNLPKINSRTIINEKLCPCSENNDEEEKFELYLKELEKQLIKEERKKLSSCEQMIGNNKENLVRSHGFTYKPVKDVGTDPCPEILTNETETINIPCSTRNNLLAKCFTRFRKRTNNHVPTKANKEGNTKDLQEGKCTENSLKQTKSNTKSNTNLQKN